MEIQAKISFKNGRIIRILNKHDIDIKKLSDMCGWNYQGLLHFISFKRIPKKEDINILFATKNVG